MPKSVSQAQSRAPGSTNTARGVRSVWISQRVCAASRASATPDEQPVGAAGVERPLGDQRRERARARERHDHVRAARALAAADDRGEVRVEQRRARAQLAVEGGARRALLALAGAPEHEQLHPRWDRRSGSPRWRGCPRAGAAGGGPRPRSGARRRRGGVFVGVCSLIGSAGVVEALAGIAAAARGCCGGGGRGRGVDRRRRGLDHRLHGSPPRRSARAAAPARAPAWACAAHRRQRLGLAEVSPRSPTAAVDGLPVPARACGLAGAASESLSARAGGEQGAERGEARAPATSAS